MKKIFLVLLLAVVLVGCGSTASLSNGMKIEKTVVTIDKEFNVIGKLVNVTDSTITLIIEGNEITYPKSRAAVRGTIFELDSKNMQADIVENTALIAKVETTILFLGTIAALVMFLKQ